MAGRQRPLDFAALVGAIRQPYRQFYVTYPQIRQTVSAESLPGLAGQIRQSLPAESAKVVPDPAAPATISTELTLPGQALLERLAFSHFAELVAIDDPLKRAFYEIECMQWRTISSSPSTSWSCLRKRRSNGSWRRR